MSNLALPGPDGPQNDDDFQDQTGPSDHARRRGHPGPRRRKTNPKIPSAEACLAALAQLPGLVALKYLSPAEANAVRGVYQAILRHYERSHAASAQPGIADADLLTIARTNPEVVSMLEPLLTDAQMDLIFGDDAESDNDA